MRLRLVALAAASVVVAATGGGRGESDREYCEFVNFIHMHSMLQILPTSRYIYIYKRLALVARHAGLQRVLYR
jgi:hypothetical protein